MFHSLPVLTLRKHALFFSFEVIIDIPFFLAYSYILNDKQIKLLDKLELQT